MDNVLRVSPRVCLIELSCVRVAVTLCKGVEGETQSSWFSCLLLTFFVQDFLQDVATKTVPDPSALRMLPPSLRRQKDRKKKKINLLLI